MLTFGQKEIDAFAQVARSGELFRYHKGGQCERFEQRWGKFLQVPYVHLTAGGTPALTAALGALGIGPGDEVIVPAHTYMATAIAVLAVGAIPVIVDIDESIDLCPDALADAIGPRTRAVIPVHMWGTVCDMDRIQRVARKHKLLVVEDACQCVGGEYRGRKAGAIGHAGAFSFNFFKNMTCGEGGAVVTGDEEVSKRAKCMVDCCSFFWSGRKEDFRPFAASGARSSEFEGAMLNAQFDQVPALLRKLRGIKRRILTGTAGLAKAGLTPAKANDLAGECCTNLLLQLPTAEAAAKVAAAIGACVAGNTGRHTYTEWDPVLTHQGSFHPALNPYNLPQNKRCRMKYSKDMCPRSLDILSRTVLKTLSPAMTRPQIAGLIATLKTAVAAETEN